LRLRDPNFHKPNFDVVTPRLPPTCYSPSWASAAARWRISAATPRKRKRRAAARPTRCLKMPSAYCCLERAPGQANVDDTLADDRRRHYSALLVSVGALSRVSNHQRNRLTHARSRPRRRRVEPHSCAVMPIVLAARTVRGACAPIADEHRRRNARGASVASAWRVRARGRQSFAARFYHQARSHGRQ